jgi:hypothetical protein
LEACALAISHPHYSTRIAWIRAFDAPVELHSDDRAHIMRPDSAVDFRQGEVLPLWDDLTLVRCGDHFAEGQRALLRGDIIMAVQARIYVSFLYSYPNLIPLPEREVRRVATVVEPYAFERISGTWWNCIILRDAKGAVRGAAALHHGDSRVTGAARSLDREPLHRLP